jgi:hypothetical protein
MVAAVQNRALSKLVMLEKYQVRKRARSMLSWMIKGRRRREGFE